MQVRDGEELFDRGSFERAPDPEVPRDPLSFPGYADAATKVGREAIAIGSASISGRPVEIAEFDFEVFGGSMGMVVGESLALGLERAAERGVPFVLHTRTGGARMQEGMAALAQMAKVVVARKTLAESHQPLIVVLDDPTTGGVLASIASLADVTFARAGSTIAFAGPRVAEVFLGRALLGSTHNAESALSNGLIDDVFDGPELAAAVGRVIDVLAEPAGESAEAPAGLQTAELDPWAAVVGARSETRPRGPELVALACTDHVVLRGDRAGRDDPGIVCAMGRVHGRAAMWLAFDRTSPPGPSAYRKAQRCMDIAERLRLPIVTLIDTPGANPAETSEAGGIAWAISSTFDRLLSIDVPVVSVVTGEGGSGGALALTVADYVLAYEGAIFSVISPEAAAAILWRDPTRASEAATSLKLTAATLRELGIADALLAEPLEAEYLADAVAYHLDVLSTQKDLAASRRRRWRRDGHREEGT